MWLSIDLKKIEELKKQLPRQSYVVTIANFEPQERKVVEIPPADAHTTVSVLPPEAKARRERLAALRRTFIERGGEVAKSAEDLARIIDETRGR